MARWSPGERLIVLGAGATRGASWATERANCQPPLDADFFTQLQRLSYKKNQDVVEKVLRDIIELHGADFSLTLEQYFSELSSLLEMGALVPSGGYKKERLTAMRANLLNAIAAVLEESAGVTTLNSAGRQNAHRCTRHSSLVKALAAKDTVLSFNYDCVIDYALKMDAPDRWSARYGYGFPRPSSVKNYEHWQAADAPDTLNTSINLLKLHGSINFPVFKGGDDTIRLRERVHRQTGNESYEIIPPTMGKDINRPPFNELWKRAEQAIRRARVVCLIGFSFPPTDIHVSALFRNALHDNDSLDRLVIVNPSRDARQRTRHLFHRNLAAKAPTRVIEYYSFAEFEHQATFALDSSVN